MARFPVFAQGVRDRRRSLTWWSLGVAVYIAIIASVWPSMAAPPAPMVSTSTKMGIMKPNNSPDTYPAPVDIE